ncbi:MAG: hypothetical protein PWP52_1650 [Bacteroidales bacterium]|nr:hypothetical protein [Bacteroidales bacterium]MDN5355790.1 hypothetical protein [Rikenellaceae bacterium]
MEKEKILNLKDLEKNQKNITLKELINLLENSKETYGLEYK